jgi:transcriptional regulator with XRE-family HTH domain
METGADLARRLGLRLRERRTDLDRTLSETAKQASVSVSYLSTIENGNNLPSLPILARIVNVLGLSLNELLHDVGESDIAGGSIDPLHRGVATLSQSGMQLTVVAVSSEPGETCPAPVELADAEVFIHLRSGELEITIDGSVYVLREGDSLDTEAPGEITYRVVGPEPSLSIWAAAKSPSLDGR